MTLVNTDLDQFPMEIIEKIAKRLKENYGNSKALASIYKWDFPNLPKELNDEFREFKSEYSDGNTPSSYGKTIKLREFLEKYLNKPGNVEKKELTHEWIVKNWGGIKTGKDENLTASIAGAVKTHNDDSGKFEFSRIASWSKALAFQYPERRAIYDVRVIYSLNWLLLKAEYEGKFFPSPSGRNSLINFFAYEKELYNRVLGLGKIKLAFEEELSRRMDSKKSMKSSMINSLGKDVYIDKKYAYKSYCNILADISKQVFGIDGFGVTKIEMILFSIADGDIVGEVLEATP